MSKRTDFSKVITELKELHERFPNHGICHHLSNCLADYGDFWGVTDKELLFALEKYQSELELGETIVTGLYLEKIIEDGKNLDKLFTEEEDDYGD